MTITITAEENNPMRADIKEEHQPFHKSSKERMPMDEIQDEEEKVDWVEDDQLISVANITKDDEEESDELELEISSDTNENVEEQNDTEEVVEVKEEETTEESQDQVKEPEEEEQEIEPTAEVAYKEYPKKTVVATGYTAGYESTGKTESHPEYGITFSGLKVQRDTISTIAADLSVFPLGTVLYVPDYGYGIVTDIGGAIKGNIIDLYYETVDEVFVEWGKREVDVYVIEVGDGVVTSSDLNYWEEQIITEAVTAHVE